MLELPDGTVTLRDEELVLELRLTVLELVFADEPEVTLLLLELLTLRLDDEGVLEVLRDTELPDTERLELELVLLGRSKLPED